MCDEHFESDHTHIVVESFVLAPSAPKTKAV